MPTIAANQKISTWHAAAELSEILSAAALAICIVLVRGGWLVGALLTGVLLLLLSITLNARADSLDGRTKAELEKELLSGSHVVTIHRLKTLEVLNVEEDIRKALELQLDKPPLPARQLVALLESTLGRERAQQKLQVILRHTRKAETDPPEAPSSGGPQ